MTQNFVIKFDATESEDRFRFSVIESPAGRAEGEIRLPVTFEDLIPSLNRFGFQLKENPKAAKKKIFGKNKPRIWTPQDLGNGLREMLFSNSELDKCWRESLGRANDQIKLFLQFDTSTPSLRKLMRIPWELMYSEDDGLPYAVSEDLCITRFIQPRVEKLVTPLMDDMLRMLVVVAEPSGYSPFQAEKYVDAIKKWEEDLGLEIKVLENATRDALYEMLTSESFTFLYFIGHGGYFSEKGQWTFALEDRNRRIDPLTSTELASLVKDQAKDIRLITMLSCDSGEIDNWNGFNKFGGLAGDLLKAGIGHVVAMQFPVSFQAAEIFNQEFFKKLLNTRRIDYALAATRKAMLFKQRSLLEWITPVWFSATKNLEIFKPAIIPTIYVNTVKSGLKKEDVQQERNDFEFYDFANKFKKRKIHAKRCYPEILGEFWRLQGRFAVGSKKIRFEGEANLSMWVALGFVFNRTCGKALSYLQVNKSLQSYQSWSTSQPPKDHILFEKLVQMNPEGNDLVVTIFISRNCEGAVEQFLHSKKFTKKLPQIKSWLKLSNIQKDSGRLLRDGGEALGLAQKIGHRIQAVADSMVPETIHLFLLAPSGFCLFLGRELNAMGRIQVYEYLDSTYEPSFLLERK